MRRRRIRGDGKAEKEARETAAENARRSEVEDEKRVP